MYCKGGDLVKKVREGYKMTKLGEIPNEWRILKLSEIAEINPRRESLDDNSIVSFIAMEMSWKTKRSQSNQWLIEKKKALV